MLKGAFGEARKVIHHSQNALNNAARLDASYPRYKPELHSLLIPPVEFDLTLLRLLWLTNVDFTDPAVLGSSPEHFRALVSKGLDPYRIRNDAENDGYAVFLYVHWGATEGGFLKSARADGAYSYDIARQAVQFYVQNVHRLIDIPPRRLKQIADVILYNADLKQRDLRLQAMLRSTDQRPKLKLPESWVPVLLWPDRLPTRQPPEPPVTPNPVGDNDPQPDPDPPPAASAPSPPEPTGEEPAPAPTSEDLSRESVEKSCAVGLDAVLNAKLPPAEARHGAFFGAIEQLNAMGSTTDEQVLEFIRRVIAKEPDRIAMLFAPDTPREILRQAETVRSCLWPINQQHPRELAIHTVVLTDEQRSQITERWELRGWRGRSSPERRALAIENRLRAFHLIDLVNDDAFADYAAKRLRGQKLLFWDGISNDDLDDLLAKADDAKSAHALGGSPPSPPPDPEPPEPQPPAADPEQNPGPSQDAGLELPVTYNQRDAVEPAITIEPELDPFGLPTPASAEYKRLAAHLVGTPLSALELDLAEIDDRDFRQLKGDPSEVQSATVVRRRLFAAATELSKLGLYRVDSGLLDYLSDLGSSKFWVEHIDPTLWYILELAKKRMAGPAKKAKNPIRSYVGD